MNTMSKALIRRGEAKILKTQRQVPHADLVRLHFAYWLVDIDLLEGQVVVNISSRMHCLEQVQQLPTHIINVRRLNFNLFIVGIIPQLDTVVFKDTKSMHVRRVYVAFECSQALIHIVVLNIAHLAIVIDANDGNLELLIPGEKLLVEVALRHRLLEMLLHCQYDLDFGY